MTANVAIAVVAILLGGIAGAVTLATGSAWAGISSVLLALAGVLLTLAWTDWKSN